MINVTQKFLKDWLESLFLHAMASDESNENYRCELELTPKAVRDIKNGRTYLVQDDIRVKKIKKTHKGYPVEEAGGLTVYCKKDNIVGKLKSVN